jgi:hypothetical protein
MDGIGLINKLLDMEEPDVLIWEKILDWDIQSLSKTKEFIKMMLNLIQRRY